MVQLLCTCSHDQPLHSPFVLSNYICDSKHKEYTCGNGKHNYVHMLIHLIQLVESLYNGQVGGPLKLEDFLLLRSNTIQ